MSESLSGLPNSGRVPNIAKQLDRSENAVKLKAYWLNLSLDMGTEAGL